jgi:RNA ligase (TIGR02306 family)
MKGINCYISVKMDGTSATFSNYNGDIHVCSRNLSKKESDKNIYWIIFKKYKLEEVLKELGNFAIQGEICAPGIQKNPIGLKEPELFIFSIFNIDKSLYLDYRDLLSVCNKYNLKTVPIEKENIVFDFNLDQLLEMAKGKYENTGKNREGIVIRPMIETYSKILKGRMSFKVINNDYLLKEED